MSTGKARVTFLGSTGFSQAEEYSDWAFLNTASTVKDGRRELGDRVITPDGRVYRYAKAGTGGVLAQMGAANTLRTINVAVAPAQAAALSDKVGVAALAAGVVGSYRVTFTKDATCNLSADGVIAEDELRGAYIVIGNGSAQSPQMRCIVGNPASATGAASLTVTLDAPLLTAVTVGTTTIEVMFNPYNNLSGNYSNSGYTSFLGVPAAVATVGQYFWLQTWGPCWITSDSNTCNSVSDREIFFVANGSVVSGADASDTTTSFQRAGFAMDASSSGASNAPMVMLQISI